VEGRTSGSAEWRLQQGVEEWGYSWCRRGRSWRFSTLEGTAEEEMSRPDGSEENEEKQKRSGRGRKYPRTKEVQEGYWQPHQPITKRGGL
jgi:hypothetical protein